MISSISLIATFSQKLKVKSGQTTAEALQAAKEAAREKGGFLRR